MPASDSRSCSPPNGLNQSASAGLTVTFTLTAEQLDMLAELVAARVAPAPPAATPWLSTRQAADYLAAPPSRVHDLVAARKLVPRRDGKRLLFRREDLDAYLEGSR